MRSIFRSLYRTRQRWKKNSRVAETGVESLTNDQSLRKKIIIEIIEQQRRRQQAKFIAMQQAIQDKKLALKANLQGSKEPVRNFVQSSILQQCDNTNTVMLKENFIQKGMVNEVQLQELLALKRKSLKDLEMRKALIKEAIECVIEDKKNAFNSTLTKRKEALHNRRQKLYHTLECHKMDLENAYQIRRKLLQDALAARKDKLRSTEERLVKRGRLIIEDIRETKEKMKERMEEVVEKENIYTIPNLLCVTRIAFSPYLGYLIVCQNFEYALGFMVIAGISDFMDGWIARNFKSQSSNIGSFLDPMADKILIGTLFLTLTYVDLIPVLLTGLIVARDISLVAAGFIIRYKSLPPPRTLSRYFDATHATAQLAPTLISKVNTVVQLCLVGTTLAAPVFNYVDHPALTGLCFLTAATTVVSALSYVISKDTYRILRNQQ